MKEKNKKDKKNDRPHLIFMYGYPAAGKTTYSKALHKNYKLSNAKRDCVLISADEVREELYGSQDAYGNPMEVFTYILDKMREALLDGKSVIYDAANLKRSYRMDYLNELQYIDCRKTIVRMNASKEECIKRHSARGRNIPIQQLLPYFDINEPPLVEEGWDSINDIAYGPHYNYYIASPFFELEQRKKAFELAETLRKMGHCVYLSFEHKIEDAWGLSNAEWGKTVFENDIDAIQHCNVVIVLSYGRNSTAGTNWEAGYAYGIRKPVFVVEMPGVKLMSLMLMNGCYAVFKNTNELINAIKNEEDKTFYFDYEMEQK